MENEIGILPTKGKFIKIDVQFFFIITLIIYCSFPPFCKPDQKKKTQQIKLMTSIVFFFFNKFRLVVLFQSHLKNIYSMYCYIFHFPPFFLKVVFCWYLVEHEKCYTLFLFKSIYWNLLDDQPDQLKKKYFSGAENGLSLVGVTLIQFKASSEIYKTVFDRAD